MKEKPCVFKKWAKKDGGPAGAWGGSLKERVRGKPENGKGKEGNHLNLQKGGEGQNFQSRKRSGGGALPQQKKNVQQKKGGPKPPPPTAHAPGKQAP